jgi:uncharacterized MAPEG superfamily protein
MTPPPLPRGRRVVLLRCVCIAAYLGDRPSLRSPVWLLGLVATTALMLLGAFA